MKIRPEHYATLKKGITEICHTVEPIEDEKEYRWSLLDAAVHAHKIPVDFVAKTLYDYLNDPQIDTALKRVVKELEL